MARTYETFTTSGTFTVPEGVTEVIVVCYGAGAVGGLGTTLHGGIPGPGGGGGASSKTTLSVDPSDTISYSIGAGATYTSYIGNTSTGGNGGDTTATYESTMICRAKGGLFSANGTAGGLGGSAASGIGDYKVSGGDGSAGNSTYGGGGGSCGSCSAIDGDEDYTQAGNNGSTPTGGAATTIYGSGSNGAGGAGGQSGHVSGYIGGNYGGGGGGTSPLGSFDDADRPGSGGNGWIEFSYEEEEEDAGPGGGGAGAGNHIFLTFRNLAIPKGAQINKAFVTLTGAADNGGIWAGNTEDTLNAIICGHDVDSSDPPEGYEEANEMARTISQVEWNEVEHWTTPGGTHETPNIACVIQEIVNRSGWVSGNNLTIFIEYNGGTEDSLAITRMSKSYDDSPSDAAKLSFYWTHAYTASGGLAFGGSAVPIDIITATGGMVFGGSAAVTQGHKYIASGGLVFGGKGIVYAEHIATGGMVFGGEATVVKGHAAFAEGGMVFGGTSLAVKGHFAIASGGLTFSGAPWLYRKKLTVPSGAVTENFSKFYLPVATTTMKNGTDEVFFTSLTGQALAYEVRNYDPLTGRLWAIVKVPLQSASATQFYLYYGRND